VLAPTFSDFEVVVVNDRSPDTDALERVVAPYRPRITNLRQDNRGASAARNTGTRQARDQYVAFLDGGRPVELSVSRGAVTSIGERRYGGSGVFGCRALR
jgi:cellulose synthase/poly-beta-1,6-N-acetylglucosamine synthase-like glycosyltransferase